MKFTKTDNNTLIEAFRSELYKSLKAPIDAMWEQMYIGASQHYLIENELKTIGYCCIDDNKSLKQIFLSRDLSYQMSNVIRSLIELGLITSASLSSNEPLAFNACLFHSKSLQTNTFCFEYSEQSNEDKSILNIEQVSVEHIPAVKTFMKEQIGFDDTFGYTENLVQRKEIFMIKESDTIIATSECRWSDSQSDIADLGIIVNKDYRGKGIATQVLKQQMKRVLDANRKPICSTTLDNVASKRAIEKAGFYCSNIIFDINFIGSKNHD